MDSLPVSLPALSSAIASRIFYVQIDVGSAEIAGDPGPGTHVEERDSVLRRFYRTVRSRQTGGNGLGLGLVAAVARLHGLRL